jgi:NAD(P)-dependent dehydrogenase (short-subunit alcohol dehydrogenase family)
MTSLADKICVVTGGAQGIGAAVCDEFAEQRARLAILDVDGALAEARASELRERGIVVVAYQCDVADRASVVAVAEEARSELGPADVLVNSAGLAFIGPSLEFPEDEWRRSLDVMATGVFFCCQAFGRQMAEAGRGAIVNITSINATVAFPVRLAYNAAKAAVKSMTEVLAIEWASQGIRVNAVAPGVTRTALVERAIEAGHADEDAYVERTPMRRLAEPAEIAKAVLFLASEEQSGFVTGHSLVVDGGWTAYGFVGERAR